MDFIFGKVCRVGIVGKVLFEKCCRESVVGRVL